MNHRHSWLCALLLSASVASGADTLHLANLSFSKQLALQSPILLDSVNLDNQAYTQSLLLSQTSVNTNDQYWTMQQADSTGVFKMQLPTADYAIGLVRLQAETTDYTKAKLVITCKSLFEVFQAEKSIGKRTTATDSPLSLSITLEPGQSDIFIKYIHSATSGQDLKVAFVGDTSLLSFSPTAGKLLTIEGLMTGTRIGRVSSSASGKYMLAMTMLTNQAGKRTSQIQLIEEKTGSVLHRFSVAQAPRWMPQTDAVYFKEEGVDGSELVQINAATLEKTTLATQMPKGSFVMSPNEKELIFTIRDKSSYKKKDVFEITVPDDRIPGWKDRTNLYLYSLETGIMQRLTYGYHNVSLCDIHPNGEKIILSQNNQQLGKLPFDRASFYELDLNNLQIDTLFQKAPYLNNVLYGFSDGQYVLQGSGYALDSIGLKIEVGQTSNAFDGQAFLYQRRSQQVDPITRNFDPAVSNIRVHRATGKIYMECTDRDYVNLYAYDVAKGTFEALPCDVDVVSSWSIGKDSKTLVYAGSSTSYPDQAFNLNLKNKQNKLVLNPEKQTMQDMHLGEVKDWSFESNGSTIAGRYYLPPHFDASKKYPMVVYYYSGTTPTNRSFYHPYLAHLYAAQGYVVYVLQPSGTIGFGQEFAARHVNAWGIQTADDIITGVKTFCEKHNFVDANRVGCMGASYGGFMTMYLQTRTDIFAAAVSHAGISTLSSYWGEGYWGYSYSAIASADSYPWNKPDFYVGQSPLFAADKINTPLLLLHGTKDTNVPIGESIQMFAALKLLNKDVNFVAVEGENHGIATFDKRLEWKKTIFAFFAKYLKKDPTWWNSLYPERLTD